MAKDGGGDNTILYLIGAVAAYYLFLRPAGRAVATTPVTQARTQYLGPPVESVANRWLREGVTVSRGQSLPQAPRGYQWYTEPTGNPGDEILYTLEPTGTVHALNVREVL